MYFFRLSGKNRQVIFSKHHYQKVTWTPLSDKVFSEVGGSGCTPGKAYTLSILDSHVGRGRGLIIRTLVHQPIVPFCPIPFSILSLNYLLTFFWTPLPLFLVSRIISRRMWLQESGLNPAHFPMSPCLLHILREAEWESWKRDEGQGRKELCRLREMDKEQGLGNGSSC